MQKAETIDLRYQSGKFKMEADIEDQRRQFIDQIATTPVNCGNISGLSPEQLDTRTALEVGLSRQTSSSLA